MTNKTRLVVFCTGIALFALCLPNMTASYELQAHDQITRQAFAKSTTLSDQLFARLAIEGSLAARVFPNSSNHGRTVQALVTQGAVFEDNASRPVNHFFNPWTGSGSIGYAAPDWALAESPLIVLQEWSYANARAALYLGLTSPTQAERDRNLGNMFESLGHVAHLLQDMAQPQHVRSDLHFDKLERTHSRYESWVDKHLFHKALFGRLTYPNAYSASAQQLTTPRSFFNTGTPATVTSGKGIAEFTTRNFLSAGTNFTGTSANPIPNGNFPQPANPFATESIKPFEQGYVEIPPGAVIEFLGTNVTDTLVPEYSGTNVRATSFSLFDQDLARIGKQAVFTLNEFNFLPAAQEFLLPRAVAYSAGMFDYFFRGDIDLRPDPARTGKYVVANNSFEAMRGLVAFYYDALDGTRKQLPGATWNDMAIPAKDALTGFAGLGPPISLPSPSDAATPGKYLIVFRGDMGDERRGDQFANAAQGAVVGQVVTAVPLEALYVAGLDAAGRLITLRVDEGGTHLLSGPDPAGSMRDTFDFDPVRPLGASGTLNQRGYYIKQTKFLDAGATQYRVQSFSGPGNSFVRNPLTGKVTTGVAPGWVATSPDPHIGTFFFTTNIFGPNSGSLTYTRSYIDGDGKVALAAGTVPLPPLPNYDPKVAATAYHAFTFNSKLVVSESGLLVHGLRTATRVLSPNETWEEWTPYPRTITTTQYDISLVLTLAETPSVAAIIDRVTTRVENWNLIGIGGVWTPVGYGGAGGCAAFALWNNIGDVQDTYSLTGQDKIWVGQMEGDVHVIDIDENDWSRSHSSNDFHNDVSGGTDCIWTVAVTVKSHKDDAGNFATTYHLRDGGVASTDGSTSTVDSWYDPLPFLRIYDCRPFSTASGLCAVSGDNATPMSKVTGPFENHARKNIVRAFTANSTGIVWSEQTPQETIRFRGTDVTGKMFVGDASPLGEVFFATADMSLIIHDVKNGRMPQFVPPSNMVQIVAALWL